MIVLIFKIKMLWKVITLEDDIIIVIVDIYHKVGLNYLKDQLEIILIILFELG